MQAFSVSASVFRIGVGAVPVEGKFAPGAWPVVVFTRLASLPAARSRPLKFVELAPTLPPVERNCANAYALATVVASLTVKLAEPEMALQAPSVAIKTMPGLDGPVGVVWPPRAMTYSSETLYGQVYGAEIWNAPVVSVVLADPIAVADPLPVEPAA